MSTCCLEPKGATTNEAQAGYSLFPIWGSYCSDRWTAARWALGYSALEEAHCPTLEYSLLSRTALFSTLSRAALLVLLGLSASTAFASGALNLGQSGQFLIGAMAATVFGLFVNLPAFLQIPLSLAVAALAGMLYASIAAFFRRRFNMNELIVTLMLNFVADYFTQFLIAGPLFEEGRQSPASPAINASGWFPVYKGFDTGILVALLAFILIYLLWNRSKTGYDWTIMGQNSIFSRIGGCPNEENFTKAMLVSGALRPWPGPPDHGRHPTACWIKASCADDGIMIAIVANNKVVATAYISVCHYAYGGHGYGAGDRGAPGIRAVLTAVLLL